MKKDDSKVCIYLTVDLSVEGWIINAIVTINRYKYLRNIYALHK